MDDLVEKVAERISNTGINGGDPLLEFIVASFAELGVGMYEGIENDAAKDIEALAKATLSAIQETHAIVPIEPTTEMLLAGLPLRGYNHKTSEIYKAMIEASPLTRLNASPLVGDSPEATSASHSPHQSR